jgi:hypothetical protein
MWSRNDRLQLAGVIVAVLTLLAGVVVTVAVPEIRCRLHLSNCAATRQPSSGGSPSSASDIYVDVPTLPDTPGFSSRREPFPPVGTPQIAIGAARIVNPGHPVTIGLTGSGFHPETIADIDWNMPDGTTYEGTGTYVGEDGTFDIGLYWWPMQGAGIAGNNGRWQITVTDRTSKAAVHTSYEVVSDDTTPSPDQWITRETYSPPPTGHPTVRAIIRGGVCRDNGARVQLEVSGFPPDVSISINTLRTDGGRIESQGWQTDGYGNAHNLVTYFALDACPHDGQFVYRDVVTAAPTIRASTDVILTG